MRPFTSFRLPATIGALLAVLLFAAACGASSTAPAGPPGDSQPAASAASGASAAPVAAGSPVPGNSIALPVPSDIPAAVSSRLAEPSCGGIVSFEVDPDVSPAPTLPTNLTSAAAAERATGCLLSAWQGHRAASLETAETTDEQDNIFTIYRLPGDGTLDLIVRLDSWTEKTVTWTETTCRGMTLQDGRVTPTDCDTEHSIG